MTPASGIWTEDWGSGPDEDWSGGRASSKRLPRGDSLGASVYELPPGGFAVYHFHHVMEEMLVVLRGQPTLRTEEGERDLEEGDVAHFVTGREGAHALVNRTSEPVRYLMVSTLGQVEIAEYPELGQLTAQSRQPSQTGEPPFVIHQLVEREDG